MEKKNKIALFDFDGTLTRADSMFLFLRFVSGSRLRYATGLLKCRLPLAGVAAGLMSAPEGKRRLLLGFLKGKRKDDVVRLCDDFAAVISRNLKRNALKILEKYRSDGYENVIVSASAGMWIRPWAEKTGLIDRVVTTEIELIGDPVSDILYAEPNCKGREKVERISRIFSPRESYYIEAYGDSEADLPMLDYADKAFFKVLR